MNNALVKEQDTFKKYEVVVHCDSRLPLVARKIFNVLISFNNAQYGSGELQTIPENEVIKRLGKSRKHINYYREQFILLGKTNFDFYGFDENNQKFYGTCSILSGAIVDEGKQEWAYTTPNKIVEWINQRSDQITLSLSVQDALNSKYSLAMYEELLCKMDGKDSLVTLTPEEIRFVTCGIDKHLEYKYLKKQVIKPAIEEVTEQTNLDVVIDSEERVARKVARINFAVKVKDGSEAQAELITEMNQEFGIDIGMAVRLSKEYDRQHIQNALAYTQQKLEEGAIVALAGRKTPNVGGFAVNAIRKGMVLSHAGILDKSSAASAEAGQPKGVNKTSTTNPLDVKAIQQYLAEDPAREEQLKQQFVRRQTDQIVSVLLDKDGFSHPIVEHHFLIFVARQKK